MRHILRSKVALAVLALAPMGAALVAQPASAQTYQYRVAESTQGTVRSLAISSDAGLRPGATLRLHVQATPGARWANVSLGDDVRVALRERAPGDYVGTHVIRRGDRIDPTDRMMVRAGWSERPVAMAFDYPASLRTADMGAGPAAGPVEVRAFTMWPRNPDRLDPGQVVRFRVDGTPGARAWVEVPGVVRGMRLDEERPGSYVGSYTIRRQDDTDAFRDARVVLRSGDERATARLSRERGNYGYGYGR
ncbi:hypothetical protein H8N03_06695 [Ramlibacter sp. USB13]|uniref:HlyD family efflux transporter periplasmic adaptor subunit n=1 Tax=Ramlibacter cellulosilyticus TaxID=2764187 RepID=A0A923MN00_9BURK|nr:hypothetical protein [Ramlibacter cellulosilyticus]MBC5782627.1 hypothetical protein [Ramlibacter cellulosilyticus]